MSSCIKPNGTINLTRGDTFYAVVKLYNFYGDSVTLNELDKVRFALKESYDSCRPILVIDIPVDTMTLRIAPEDTKHLRYGTYVYDIEVTFTTGDIDTVIPRKTFNLMEEVL